MLFVYCVTMKVSHNSQAQIENIKEEMFFAARGKYMELVVGRRAAEDDEHTEVSITNLAMVIFMTDSI